MFAPELIKAFLDEQFSGKYKIVSGGREATINSIFEDDSKYHMSINLQTGLWQDFKSGLSGNFPMLVSHVLKITVKQASSDLTFKSLLLGYDIDEPFVSSPNQDQEEFCLEPTEFAEKFQCEPLYLFGQNLVGDNNGYFCMGINMLQRRGLYEVAFSEDRPWFIAVEGDFQGRLIIPFYTDDGKIFFFQGRSVYPDAKVKYKNYKGIKSSQILYPFDWGAEYVVVTEGPIDAITLQHCGINATSLMGSHMSNTQAKLLRSFGEDIVLSFDNDDVGREAMKKEARHLVRQGLPKNSIFMLPVAKGYKDWNEYFSKKKSKKKIREYVLNNTLDPLRYHLFSILD